MKRSAEAASVYFQWLQQQDEDDMAVQLFSMDELMWVMLRECYTVRERHTRCIPLRQMPEINVLFVMRVANFVLSRANQESARARRHHPHETQARLAAV